MCHSKHGAKLAMLILLSLVLFYYGVSNVHCSTVHMNRQDFLSLLEFKRGIHDPNGALSNWNLSTHFCHWNGVNCTLGRPWRVRELVLKGKGLVGQISSSLGNLTFLNILNLSNNSFHGPIPMLSKLQHLEHLYLGGNLLQGAIPDALTTCSNLLYISLSRNKLIGVIPTNIGFLTKLVGISLFENNLNGVIPPSLGNITTLQQVDLSENQLSGEIPHEIWQMQMIQHLALYQNNLSGGIPHNLSRLPSLGLLSLAVNMLGGTLPSNIGNALPNLEFLYLGNNTFEGQIPTSLGNSLGLKELDLSSNKFTGRIPVSFGKLSYLSQLKLGTNKLEARDDGEGWEFLDALENCTNLSILSLSNNNLHGTIPKSIANLSFNLTVLEMGGNHLSGIVPPSIQKFNHLIKLSLDSNNLTGTIEDWIGKLTKMTCLLLESNNFIGTIPLSISHLTQLTCLSLANNRFIGFIPPGLGNLKSLSQLDLSYNNFQGSIPIELGTIIGFTKLDLSSNNLSGQIPETLGNFKHIEIMRLDQNILGGNIPNTFSNLGTLSMLNLSHNNLSGPITMLKDLTFLTKVDLSYNNFQGEIPNTVLFSNASIVSLDGNPGLCGGAMDFHKPSCLAPTRSAGKVNYLVKILIPIFGFMSLILIAYFLLLLKKTSRRAYMLELSFGEHFEKVTYNDLAQATRDFSGANLIGRGSYGSVYRGRLKENKMEVAVKVFDLEMRGAERSFMAECEALRSIQHRNLLPIITACSTIDNAGNVFKALVYDLMRNGSLDAWLHKGDDEASSKRLGLTQRIGITLNVADALVYLHHDCGRPTIHCDLKPSNILLDDDMNALLGDFGIARLYADPQSTLAGTISSVGVKGTIGYIPPEYGGGGNISTFGDVYSFGIVLLEILTSKRPTDPMFKDGLDIISFVQNSFPDQIYHVIDAQLLEECKNLTQEKNVPENEIYQCLLDLLQVALSCTRSLPHERLTMKQVASKMHAIKTSHFGWKYKK